MNKKIVILGQRYAGKSTFLTYLKTQKPVINDPPSTFGIVRKKNILINNNSYHIIDIGGHIKFQQDAWATGVEESDGVIYVIDATITPTTHKDSFEQVNKSLQTFIDYLPSPRTMDYPVCFVLNKQDLVDQHPISINEARDHFNIDKQPKLSKLANEWFETSAKYGTNVMKAFSWIDNQLQFLDE